MSNTGLEALLLTLFLYAVLGISYFGWGKAFVLATTRCEPDAESVSYCVLIWVGWACTLFIFQLIHFFLPLTFFTVNPVFILGIVLSVGFFIRQRRRYVVFFSTDSPTTTGIVSIAILLISAWLASRSMLSPTNYDSGLYHFNAIRWINSFPIIPGLGNLHGRLAFNQSFFSYVAALNFYPLFGQGRSIANSFLLLLSVLTLINILLPIIRRVVYISELQPLKWMPALFCLPILAFWALTSNDLASPSPDLASGILQLVIFVVLCQTIGVFVTEGTVLLSNAIVLSILTATAITVKLSNLAFCAVIMPLVLIGTLTSSKKSFGDSALILFPAVLIILVWCIRGVVLSGAPLYPSTIGYVHTEWAVPVDRVLDEANWVYSWARQPGTHWSNVLGSWNWFAPWFQRVGRSLTDIVYPLGVFLAVGIANIVIVVFGKSKPTNRLSVQWIVILPLFAGLIFWFTTAPDLRFANALFLLLPVSAILLLASHLQKRLSSKLFAIIICALFIVCNLNLLQLAYLNRWNLKHISLNGWQGIKQVPVNDKVTKTGLRVHTPVTGDQCWDAPLPCTPYFNESLRLREPSNISSGFTVVAAEINQENAEQGAALGGNSAALHPHQ